MSHIPQWSCEKFAEETFSAASVPGGGGVAALVGSVGAALAGMVCNLTAGKAEYAQYEEDIRSLVQEAKTLKDELMAQVDGDAECFYPLSKCYAMPTDTEEQRALREREMQAALKLAVTAPAEIIRLSCRAIRLHGALVEKGSRTVLSDVGCGVLCLKAAMQCAWMNVMINLKYLNDRTFIDRVEAELKPMMAEAEQLADEICRQVEQKLAY